MRLIDADELIKRMRKWMPKDPCGREQTVEEVVATDIVASVFMEIEETPTAFDKENVIDELKKCRVYQFQGMLPDGKICHFSDVIEIVEKGGIE